MTPASSRRVTVNDIAARAGVSIAAVSFALNGRKGVSEATRQRVLSVADELGWAPAQAARSLAGASNDVFGLVLARDPNNLGVESFYMQFLSGLEKELSMRSYGLLLQVVPSAEQELATIKKWRNARQVDGVILVDLQVDDPRVRLSRKPGALPAVVVGDPGVADGLTSVWTDDATSIREAVRHLAELGHRRIAYVSGIATLAHTRIRMAAFEDETVRLGAAGMIFGTDFTMQSGAQATREALELAEPPTAFIYDNDVMAVAGLTVATERGRSVPDDVSIIAWDDSVLCEHTLPRLTALSHDVIAFGAHVGRRLFDLVDGAEPGAFLDSTPQLRLRASTGPAPRR
ncbi:LacI family DNA-binding transcriptional regulator [Microbacterium sp.]|uniref:LacI family DNA-binding transcriptional regulator n=1 Tax=Microbacterium sp. TaxID=51671 RepID=UPI00281186D0|nr:LacI family DNA-binding transcriptional regulator [Microbacterium sp.]